ncbi:E3 ubiquitin protein ligase listerin [Parastagonospora nodorum]|nr:E3 ubiquitin protein ligase listerin [Parastagonospora nodorum]KAH5200473.1 E3 ubiquitin protein ligase listerin [Parastagonospora nodorum]KAH5585409.1 E3 ubiquitin protein ligase listerin [Parastagonospora nodorum]KAH5726261.1 E3 ubiquitin protein ligase listerin [Parastagonospora nodorum]KAH6110975.1 E3 ubiquitin protein ligase listerin [Parastagonospora nodorum]
MSKRAAKSASSARAASTFGASTFGSSPATATFAVASSQLSYVSEPPDFSAISDPNVVVYFRNLSKKDSTTKAKALEDIQAYVAKESAVEEGLLEAWVKIYPRTSIDNAKAVRQNAHHLHGQIAASAGKRIAKHMPQSVAAWLCGLYDSDRSVVEATQSSLRQVFNTPEKIQNIRKAYQQPILEYCRDAIDKESTATLSDERNVTPDDAEAKYSRVISACISLLGSLLSNLPREELSKYQTDYEALLGDKKLWEFASSKDASIRRSLHRFLKTCVAKEPEAVKANLETISKSYLSVALNSDQTNSAFEYIDALTALTSDHPTAWTEHYTSKTAVDRRLRQFLKRGSQSGPRDYWARLTALFHAIPSDVLPHNAADSAELLGALQGGMIKKDEPKHNYEVAFGTYLDVVALLNARLDNEDKKKLLDEMVLPLLTQYLQPSVETSQWSLPSSAISVLAKAARIDGMAAALAEQWPTYTKQLVDAIKTSAPEQSKDYEKSQVAVGRHATRLATLQEQALKHEAFAPVQTVFAHASANVVTEALSVIKSRNGKPYGAAEAIAAILKRNSAILASTETQQELELFLREHLPALVSSPSSIYLIELLYACSASPDFPEMWSSTLKTILQEPESSARTKALEAILTSPRIPASFDLASRDSELQTFVKSSVRESVESSGEWDSFSRILQSPAKIIASDTTDDILSYLTQSLTISQQAPYSLQGLRHIVRSNPSMLREFVGTPKGSKLLQGLLLASESPSDEIAQSALAVNASIQTMLASGSDSKQSMFELIQQGLREATPTSVSVETLVDLAKQCITAGQEWDVLKNVLPVVHDWEISLAPFLDSPPRPSLAITNPLGGAVYLVDQTASSTLPKVPRDADGYSAAYRITQYVTRLLQETDLFPPEKIPAELRDNYLRLVALTIQLADDNLGLAGANGLWVNYNAEAEADAMTFISDAQPFVTQELKYLSSEWSDNGLLPWATQLLSNVEATTSPRSYYTARAYSVLISDAIEMTGWRNAATPSLQDGLKAARKEKAIMPILAYLSAFKEPLAAAKACERMCNELIADLTGVDIAQKSDEALRQLVQLNSVLGQEGIIESIAKQRLVFFVKHVVPWVQSAEVGRPIRAELCRALTVLIPIMGDMYGEHWSDLLSSLSASWVSTNGLDNETGEDSSIPFVHASLKLYAQLRSLTQIEEPNDDLIDAWKETEQAVADGLINLLKHSQHFPDEFHQPLKMVNDVLSRQIAKVSLKNLESTEELFPLLYVESQPVQQTAFNILHKQIPEAQEQISVDAALEKTTARLPEELLSLIIDAPTVAALAEANFERNVPLPLRGYLLSWLLVFDHLEHASFKVKNDYVEHIKEGEYLPGLLNFTFDFLGHAHNKPVDVSKLNVTTYEPDVEPPKRDLQWLLTHLYFMCLRHVPSLTKAWFIDCKSRATVVTLEPWTEKFISPPVISAALDSVTTWSAQQDDTSPFTVRVAPRAREITASYLIDEATCSMRISLPPAFPLANARIDSLARVAVNETKWQSWLRTSLGAITIFNGSIIDALTTFKRNVDGAMKGQVECAICYSVVGSDKRLPEKKCGTCKNLFHGGCLWKWFKSSGSSSCPLCRNPFNYGEQRN